MTNEYDDKHLERVKLAIDAIINRQLVFDYSEFMWKVSEIEGFRESFKIRRKCALRFWVIQFIFEQLSRKGKELYSFIRAYERIEIALKALNSKTIVVKGDSVPLLTLPNIPVIPQTANDEKVFEYSTELIRLNESDALRAISKVSVCRKSPRVITAKINRLEARKAQVIAWSKDKPEMESRKAMRRLNRQIEHNERKLNAQCANSATELKQSNLKALQLQAGITTIHKRTVIHSGDDAKKGLAFSDYVVSERLPKEKGIDRKKYYCFSCKVACSKRANTAIYHFHQFGTGEAPFCKECGSSDIRVWDRWHGYVSSKRID